MPAVPYYAHSLPDQPPAQWETMSQHEARVATRCAAFLKRIHPDLEAWRDLLGRWHDLGKYSDAFQSYLRAANSEKACDDDLKLLWKSLEQMFEFDRSAARGEMAARRLIVFKHDSKLGNAPAHKLFERVSVTLNNGSNGEWKPPRSFDDYKIEINDKELPEGISIEQPF